MAEVKSGYVHKCGKSVKSWKRRWFVLKTNGYLYYYEDKSSTTEKGKIDVVDAAKVGEWKEISSVNRKLPSGFSSSNAFGIVVRDRTFTCVCGNDGDSQGWIAAITKVRNADIGAPQEYPPPTYSQDKQAQELPVKPRIDEPLTAPAPQGPPPYSGNSLPRNSHISPPPPDTAPHTLPRPKAKSVSMPHAPVVEMPPLPPSNPYFTPEVKNQLSAPPPYQPQVQQAPPQYQAQQPQYRTPPPQPQYRPPPQPQYRPPSQPQYRPPPQPQYRPPPQPQYRPPPQPQYQPQPQYRPPPQPQYQPQYRPQYQPPPQTQYRPQAYAPPVRGPYPSYPQRPPVQQVQKRTTTVTVVHVPAVQQVVYR